jgi:hypothetical protein
MRLMSLTIAGGMLVLFTAPAFANGYGTDSPWSFETSTDQANLAAVQTLIQQKQNGMFHPANYNTTYNSSSTTNIAHQTNCTLSATTYGNYALNGATANSPTTTGASSLAQGNSSSSTTSSSGSSTQPLNLASNQSNTGTVGSSLTGSTTVSAGGPVNQALNNTQSNGGSQSATISNSSACSSVK